MTKLEEDFRGAVASRDQLRKKLTVAEDEKTQLAKQVDQLVLVAKERDELKLQLSARTNERDALQTQYNEFRKGLKNQLGQSESPSSMPITLSVDPALGGKVLIVRGAVAKIKSSSWVAAIFVGTSRECEYPLACASG